MAGAAELAPVGAGAVPEREYFHPGHYGCAGCGAAQALRYALKALGPDTILTIPACCASVIAGPFPLRTLQVPVLHTAFPAAASTAAGIRAGLDAAGRADTTVVAWSGDGGTFDIGLQALSGAAERNDRIIYVCYDNEAYMMTGIQRSSATPALAWTMTTPLGHLKPEPKKRIMEVIAAHRVPYAATATTAFPQDLMRKFALAQCVTGLAFIHLLTPCPTGWRLPPELSVKASRLAVESRLFPLYEVRDGREYRLTYLPKGLPVADYLRLQGRYAHLTAADHQVIQAHVDEDWEGLLQRVKATGVLRDSSDSVDDPGTRSEGT